MEGMILQINFWVIQKKVLQPEPLVDGAGGADGSGGAGAAARGDGPRKLFMNKLMEAHKRKLSPESSIVTAINGIADELYELRKENRDLQGELKNIAGSLDYVSQYLYDISWELKKNREKNRKLTTKVISLWSDIKDIETPHHN